MRCLWVLTTKGTNEGAELGGGRSTAEFLVMDKPASQEDKDSPSGNLRFPRQKQLVARCIIDERRLACRARKPKVMPDSMLAVKGPILSDRRC